MTSSLVDTDASLGEQMRDLPLAQWTGQMQHWDEQLCGIDEAEWMKSQDGPDADEGERQRREGKGWTAGRSDEPETEAHSADLTDVSAAVVGAEVSEQFTSLPGAVDRPAEVVAIGSARVEAERLEESLCTDVGVERKACPGCGDALLWTDHSDGRYIGGWACDNHLVYRVWRSSSDLSAEDWWRFCCRRCHSDFCIACAGQLVRFLGSEGENAASLFDAGSAHGSTQAGALPHA